MATRRLAALISLVWLFPVAGCDGAHTSRVISGYAAVFYSFHIKLVLAALAGSILVYAAYRWLVASAATKDVSNENGVDARADPTSQAARRRAAHVIAFNLVVFLATGLVILIAAAEKWEVGCLWAGVCLLGGGVLGLLFGTPLQSPSTDTLQEANVAASLASQDLSAKPTTEAILKEKAAKARLSAVKSKTALGEAASSLSKVVGGAGLVSAGRLFDFYKHGARCLSAYIDPNAVGCELALGGALILYFALLGFVGGLFLPAYFMKDWQE